MTTRNANLAVDAYRRLIRAEFRLEAAEADLATAIAALDSTEVGDYAMLTADIDSAVDRARAEAADRGYMASTASQLMRRALNTHGFDRDGQT